MSLAAVKAFAASPLGRNMLEVAKGGVALKIAKKSAGIALGAVAAGNELARARGDKNAPAQPFVDKAGDAISRATGRDVGKLSRFDNARSQMVGVGIGLAGAGLAGDILHRIPEGVLRRVPVVGNLLVPLAKLASHKVTHGMMLGGAAASITNFDAAGRNVAKQYDKGTLHNTAFAGLKEHAFFLHGGLYDAITKPGGSSNPFRNAKGYTPLSGPSLTNNGGQPTHGNAVPHQPAPAAGAPSVIPRAVPAGGKKHVDAGGTHAHQEVVMGQVQAVNSHGTVYTMGHKVEVGG